MTTLSVRDLTFGYSKERAVISRWTATFEPGTTTAITGPSGTGKSTLLYLLGLMLQPDGGAVLVDGQDCTKWSDSRRAWERAHRFGFVFQDAALDPTRTVMDNVLETALYRHVQRSSQHRRARDLLARMGVSLPVGRTSGQVSGGQAQRIALCRALLPDPPIVLADEPTGNLDPDSAATVLSALTERAVRGGTVVIVTHSPELASACDVRLEV